MRTLRRSGAPRGGLRRLAVLDDVALLEEHSFGDFSPLRLAAKQELEVHAEVLVLLADGIGHDAPRFGIALDRQALLVPADRLRLLGQRRAQPRERARLLRELLRRLVVLVEAHRFLLGGCGFPAEAVRERLPGIMTLRG